MKHIAWQFIEGATRLFIKDDDGVTVFTLAKEPENFELGQQLVHNHNAVPELLDAVHACQSAIKTCMQADTARDSDAVLTALQIAYGEARAAISKWKPL